MSQTAAPPRVWVRFALTNTSAPSLSALRHDRYRVEAVVSVRGAPLEGIEAGACLERVEAHEPFRADSEPLVGVTQHLVYTRGAERRELVAASSPESGPIAVLIPIRKSGAWWALAQDEREALVRPTDGKPGHITLGLEFAGRIYRRLYHARYAGGPDWDFLTYFEFPAECANDFRTLLERLRDPAQNPEWAYVERECEVWMTRL